MDIPQIPECLNEVDVAEKGKLPVNTEWFEKLYDWLYCTISVTGFLNKICSTGHQRGPWIDQAAKFRNHPNSCVTPILIAE